MLAAIAFCPSPPLLVPEVAAAAAVELDPLRAACDRAVRTLLAAGPEEIVVLATGSPARWFPAGSSGTLAGYGVPVTAHLPTGPVGDPTGSVGLPSGPGVPGGRVAGAPVGPAGPGAPAGRTAGLPRALVLGAWLLGRAAVAVPCSGRTVAAGDEAVRPGTAGRWGLLVMGDGSARRSEAAPGYVDPRAAAHDAAVAAALAAGDPAALRDLDPALGADLLAEGVPAWRATGHTAAGPGASAGPGTPGDGSGAVGAAAGPGWAAELLYDADPYGVGYLVATWVAR